MAVRPPTLSRRRPVAAPIPSYFSHSYRRDDRDLNLFFWNLFFDAGFGFAVDPKNEVLSVPYLEWMMGRSACFVAVVPMRTEPTELRCSPYQFYEIGLAVRSRKPSILFVEEGVSGRITEGVEKVFFFNRYTLSDRQKEFREEIRKIAYRSNPFRTDGIRALGKVGLIIDETADHPPEIGSVILTEARNQGFTPLNVGVGPSVSANDVLLAADSCDAIVAVLPLNANASWILPMVYGRFIPCIRLARENAATPGFELSGAVRVWPGVGGAEISFWRDYTELQELVRRHLAKIAAGVIDFTFFETGEKYFRSAGRDPVRVFLSNSSADNELATQVALELRKNNFDVFQYKVANQIAPGDRWSAALERIVVSSEIFVPMLTSDYEKSDNCKMELDVARRGGVTSIVPFVLDFRGKELLTEWGIEEQAVDLSTTGKRIRAEGRLQSQVEVIVGVLDNVRLARTENTAHGRENAMMVDQENFSKADIAVVTMLPEEFHAACSVLENARPSKPPPNTANKYADTIGEVSGHQGAYRVVVCLIGRQTNPVAASATMSIVNRWHPSYVVALGVAGGFPRESLVLGDVVVSESIWYYEYGKILDEFEPRTDYIYQVNGPLLAAAKAVLPADWTVNVGVKKPDGDISLPKMIAGPIASGDKVIDRATSSYFEPVLRKWPKIVAVEMEAAGIGEAIKGLREDGNRSIDYLVIRGVSDMPQIDGARAPIPADQTQGRDDWKPYASTSAARFLAALIRDRWPVPPRIYKSEAHN